MVEVFRKFNDGLMPLCEYHDAILRGDSPLTVAERELIAAYVSGINACDFCFEAHRTFAEMHGVAPGLLERLIKEPQPEGVDDKLLPLLAYVRKLTLTPSRMTPADADAVYAAGWPEKALFHAVAVCALFNFMNRMVDGTGITLSPERRARRREQRQSFEENPSFYTDFARMVLERD